MDTNPPTTSRTPYDYGLSCEEALVPVQDLVDQAVQAGWDSREVVAAIGNVAANKADAYEEDPDPEDDDAAGAPDPTTPNSAGFPPSDRDGCSIDRKRRVPCGTSD